MGIWVTSFIYLIFYTFRHKIVLLDSFIAHRPPKFPFYPWIRHSRVMNWLVRKITHVRPISGDNSRCVLFLCQKSGSVLSRGGHKNNFLIYNVRLNHSHLKTNNMGWEELDLIIWPPEKNPLINDHHAWTNKCPWFN